MAKVAEKEIITKVFTSSQITTGGVEALRSSIGDFVIEDIIIRTDGTGLATGTNFTISTDNANGATTIFAETVANLGANVTEKLGSGSVTAGSKNEILESGKKVTLKSTVASCTGAGKIYLTFILSKASNGASIVY